MTLAERELAISIVVTHPSAGDMVAGGGSIRKLRVAMRGKGKSGGYRVLTYFIQPDEPVFSSVSDRQITAGQPQRCPDSAASKAGKGDS